MTVTTTPLLLDPDGSDWYWCDFDRGDGALMLLSNTFSQRSALLLTVTITRHGTRACWLMEGRRLCAVLVGEA